MDMIRLLVIAVSMAGMFGCEVFAAVAKPVIVPAPQKIDIAEGSFSVKAKTVDRSLYAFEKDSSLPREGYRLAILP